MLNLNIGMLNFCCQTSKSKLIKCCTCQLTHKFNPDCIQSNVETLDNYTICHITLLVCRRASCQRQYRFKNIKTFSCFKYRENFCTELLEFKL